MASMTLYDKLWNSHLVKELDNGTSLIYIDLHFLHEVTSPQAFEGLRLASRKPWRAKANMATPDHNVPTTTSERSRGVDGIVDPVSRIQVKFLDDNCKEFGIEEFEIDDHRHGIVHVIGPEQGRTLPGMTIVCGDSHTSTHGALGSLAHGIGTSEVEHVLATQCLVQKKARNMLVKVNGSLKPGVTAKDVILAIIGKIGTAGGNGHAQGRGKCGMASDQIAHHFARRLGCCILGAGQGHQIGNRARRIGALCADALGYRIQRAPQILILLFKHHMQ